MRRPKLISSRFVVGSWFLATFFSDVPSLENVETSLESWWIREIIPIGDHWWPDFGWVNCYTLWEFNIAMDTHHFYWENSQTFYGLAIPPLRRRKLMLNRGARPLSGAIPDKKKHGRWRRGVLPMETGEQWPNRINVNGHLLWVIPL